MKSFKHYIPAAILSDLSLGWQDLAGRRAQQEPQTPKPDQLLTHMFRAYTLNCTTRPNADIVNMMYTAPYTNSQQSRANSKFHSCCPASQPTRLDLVGPERLGYAQPPRGDWPYWAFQIMQKVCVVDAPVTRRDSVESLDGPAVGCWRCCCWCC
jgi:hypothetical protein